MSERGVADEMAQALATVRNGFRATAPERLAQLRRHADAWKAHTAGAASLFAQSAHALRGTAGTLGFSEVARLCAELEKLAEGDSPPFSPRIPGLLQSLSEAFSQPPSTLPLVPHRPRVVLRLTDSPFASELARALEAAGLDVLSTASDEEALRLLASDRPLERLVVGPNLAPAIRSALRTAGTPPLLIQLVPAAEVRAGAREGVDALLSLGTPPATLARDIATLQRTAAVRFRVLAVDDDPAVLATARAVLEAAGLEVVTLSDARNLFSSLQRHHPDLLLLDVAMPSVDGFELLGQLRSEPAWRNLTVIFHTAKEAAADRVRAFQLGVDDYLLKPVEPAELRVRLLAHLHRRSSMRAAAEKEATTGLATSHFLLRTLTRLLEAGGTAPVSVALLRFSRPDALAEQAARLAPRLRPSDVLARWDERTLALTRPGEEARATLAFLQAAPGPGEAQLGAVDNRTHPGTGAQALLVAAELSLGKGTESAASPPRAERSTAPSRTDVPAVSPPRTALPPIAPVPSRPLSSRLEGMPTSPSRSLPPISIPTPPPVRMSPAPREESSAAPTPRPAPPPSRTEVSSVGPGRSRRILVADDEPALRRVLQRLLEQEGYVVETVEDGEEALARLLNPSLTPVDLLLLDVHMPRRSGVDVLRALREKASPVKALVLSARVRDGDVVKLLGEGAADFVAKPFSIHTLLARVARLLPPPNKGS